MTRSMGPHPMWRSGQGSGSGLLEKRLITFSSLSLSHTVSTYGNEWNRELEDTLFLDYSINTHVNNASDPASGTLTMSQGVVFNMTKPRSLSSSMLLSDFAHASLDGYYPSGTGDADLSKHEMTANETVLVGQPVYVSGNNTINLGDASSINTSNVVGLVSVGASANGTSTVLTEGSVNQADWSNVISTSLLTPGATYFLSVTSGKMSTTPPTGNGESVVTLGTALTTTKFDIEVNKVAAL